MVGTAPLAPGRAIDTDRYFVISSDIIGGCSGSTGPTSIDPRTGETYAMHFPIVTIGDMVNAQRRLIERLGVTSLVAVGGSIGGYQALEWATRHPDLVSATIAIAASGRLSPFGIATHSEIGRRAIMADPDWREGDYARFGVFPASGLAIARMAAMLTYQGREIMEERFGRSAASRPSPYAPFGGTYDVEGYLHHQGRSLVQRFDANSYLYLTRAMDLYDLGGEQGDDHWLRQIAAPLLLVGIRTDWLYPPEEIWCAWPPRQLRSGGTPPISSSTRLTGTMPSSRNGTRSAACSSDFSTEFAPARRGKGR